MLGNVPDVYIGMYNSIYDAMQHVKKPSNPPKYMLSFAVLPSSLRVALLNTRPERKMDV